MRGASELAIALLDLVAAETRAARRGLVDTALALFLGVAAALFGIAGVGLALLALHGLLDQHLSAPASTLGTSMATLGVCALTTWLARRVVE